jgi:hypothetical protein
VTARIIDMAGYREERRAKILAEADVLHNGDAVDACDWCSETTLVDELRDAGHLFDPHPGGEPMVGHICPLCVQQEHDARERADTDGVYNGTDYER